MNYAARVERAAAKAALAEEKLVVAILEARANGLTLRTIGEAASMSHEQVRRMTQEG